MTVTIHNMGRPLHDFRIHVDTSQRPATADCTCGATWCNHEGQVQSVMQWGLTHIQPDPSDR